MLYSIDTSALIYASRSPYRMDSFPGFWRKMDELMRNGTLAALTDVKDEILVKDDDLSEWVKERADLFIPPYEEVQNAMIEILREFPNFPHRDARRAETDAAVIALAKANHCSVISQEKGGSEDHPKIPYVCNHFNIRCIDIYDFVAEQNWVFR